MDNARKLTLYVSPPEVPPTVWALALEHLRPAMRGQTDAETLDGLLSTADAQLWTAWDGMDCRAALVTTRHEEILHLWLCGGRGADWADLLRRIMEFAARDGVTGWTVDGRKGWTRVLKGVRNGHG
jgi:hypothetical protein